jgi:hypothetical protein
VAVCVLDDRGSTFIWDKYLFLSYQVQTHRISYQSPNRRLSPERKRPEREAEHSSPSSAEQGGLGRIMKTRVRFQVLTAASMNMAVFWVVVSRSLVEVYRRFRDGGSKCL